MSKHLIQAIAVVAVGCLYWQVICMMAGVEEPWDADAYWIAWYPVSLALSALAGWAARGRGWVASVLFTFAQLPVLGLNTGVGSLWPVGLLFVCVLAVPPAALAALVDGLHRGS